MSYTKQQLLGLLKEFKIDFSQFEHPPVLTMDDLVETRIGDEKNLICKNLFLKDKKSRYYIISALVDTKIDLKAISQRLGLGKGGVRMAPEEALWEILKVPLGSVTPFAIVNESARNVSLLVDKRCETANRCIFHALSNDTSISISIQDLDKFLKCLGRQPNFVDFEANPPVGKDCPPDLSTCVPSDSTVLPISFENQHAVSHPLQNIVTTLSHCAYAEASCGVAPATQIPHAIESRKCKETDFLDSSLLSELIMSKISSVLHLELSVGKNMTKEGAENLIHEHVQRSVGPELNNLLTMFKNTAYSEGFYAGTHCEKTVYSFQG